MSERLEKRAEEFREKMSGLQDVAAAARDTGKTVVARTISPFSEGPGYQASDVRPKTAGKRRRRRKSRKKRRKSRKKRRKSRKKRKTRRRRRRRR